MTYFEWLCSIICGGSEEKEQYLNLLICLFETPYQWNLPNDDNRARDGISLRELYSDTVDRFGPDKGGECSCLEMFIALASRWDNDFMYDPRYGDRTPQWFWTMMENMRLTCQYGAAYDPLYVTRVLERFMHHKYSHDGFGGPFYIPGCQIDLRHVELWYQMGYYIESIYEEN